jgi:hypothetical protein
MLCYAGLCDTLTRGVLMLLLVLVFIFALPSLRIHFTTTWLCEIILLWLAACCVSHLPHPPPSPTIINDADPTGARGVSGQHLASQAAIVGVKCEAQGKHPDMCP